MAKTSIDAFGPRRLGCAVVLRVSETDCAVWSASGAANARFAPHFPSPRSERVCPGNLVAVAQGPDGTHVIVWRWYDAVALGPDPDGSAAAAGVRMWEPAHGEVLASTRASYREQQPGSRAYLSAGLPGADWWVAGPAVAEPEAADVELDAVYALYTDNDMWAATFATGQ